MRLGLLPSQKRELDRAFKKAKAFDRFRVRTRRAFLGLGLGAVVGCAGAYWLGCRSATAKVDAWHARLPWAREFARQPIEVMVTGASTFLGVLQNAGHDDPELWRGFARLAQHALSRDDDQARLLRKRLLTVCEVVPPLPEQAPLVERLRGGR
ncbi:MAG: hypothetical protein R3F56_08395 [Planctomycetota bacterium]